MTRWRVPLAEVAVTEEDLAAVVEVYRSGWLSMGPRTEAFEDALATYTGARHALAVSSGTAALHLMTLAAGLGPGDEVIVPAMTFVATVNAVAYTGARPVFADIAGLEAPWLSAAAAEAVVGPRTAAILAVSYGGHPGEIAALRALAERRRLLLLEDAAHAIGARSGGRHLGRFGVAGAFSFFANKNLAVGEGGALITDDDGLAERARLMRSHGMTSLTWDRHRGHAAAYDVVRLGFNYRIDEPRTALATRRLARLDVENACRAGHDAHYREALAAVPGISPTAPPPTGPGEVPAHHLFTVVLPADADRDAVRAELGRRGVQTSVHYQPVHRFSVYREGAPQLPITEAYGVRTLTLPMFAGLTRQQSDLTVESLAAAINHDDKPKANPGTAESVGHRSDNDPKWN
jgi:dTDP-4-amino-4,6-dideoxygalactose transaminase